MKGYFLKSDLERYKLTEREALAHFILIQYLKNLGIEEEQALGIAGILKTEENITKMNWWIHDYRMNGIAREDIADKILQIMGSEE